MKKLISLLLTLLLSLNTFAQDCDKSTLSEGYYTSYSLSYKLAPDTSYEDSDETSYINVDVMNTTMVVTFIMDSEEIKVFIDNYAFHTYDDQICVVEYTGKDEGNKEAILTYMISYKTNKKAIMISGEGYSVIYMIK